MKELGRQTRAAALSLKVVGLAVGVFSLLVSLGFVYDELTFLTGE